jgi:hypothetical protein
MKSTEVEEEQWKELVVVGDHPRSVFLDHAAFVEIPIGNVGTRMAKILHPGV